LLPARTVTFLPPLRPTVTVRSGASRPVWAGVMPLALRKGELIEDSNGIQVPDYLRDDPRF